MRAREVWRGQGALLASACVLMLAVGLAARAATPVAPVPIEPGQALGPGTYSIPYLDLEDMEKALVFSVPGGIRIGFDGVGWAHCTGEEQCVLLPAFFSGGESDSGFWFCLDLATAEECGRGYPIERLPGDRIDDSGRPLRISAAERDADRAARAAKYGPLLDWVVASARVVTVR